MSQILEFDPDEYACHVRNLFPVAGTFQQSTVTISVVSKNAKTNDGCCALLGEKINWDCYRENKLRGKTLHMDLKSKNHELGTPTFI